MLHADRLTIVQNAAMKRVRSEAPALCPCGLAASYAQCCGRWHAGHVAPDAEKLMRSRYVAYVMNLEDYVLATWHASTRPAAGFVENANEKPATPKFTGLTVLAHTRTGVDTAIVEFIARYKSGGRAYRLHEISRFVHEQGRWWYNDGEVRDH